MMAQLGIAFDRPIRHLREYLSVLKPLLRDGEVDFVGELFRSNGRFFQPPEKPVEVLVAALGPQALAVAGRLARGTYVGMGRTQNRKSAYCAYHQ
jgi:alkanesulfonate monooxygenase SsuD/methylene tetrahydromethanopterin reductase-like flavin-dependent oxidoreductase (luciferase family)